MEPNGTIPFRPQPDLAKTLDIEQLTTQLRAVEATITMIEQGQGPVGQFISTDTMYRQILADLDGFERQFRKLATPSSPAGRLVFTDELYQKIKVPLDHIEASLAEVSAGRGRLGGLLRDDSQYNQIQGRLSGLRQTLSRIQGAPLIQTDDLYVAWNHALGSLIEGVDNLNTSPLLTTTEMYDNLNGFAQQVGANIRDFRQNPQKYLRIRVFGGKAKPR
jgi:phospholipid/cholesterol/gamma-HCH transport system substrate-binding protein